MQRGESLTDLQTHTLDMLVSHEPHRRWHGWRALNLCFPELAERLPDPDARHELGYDARVAELRAQVHRGDPRV